RLVFGCDGGFSSGLYSLRHIQCFAPLPDRAVCCRFASPVCVGCSAVLVHSPAHDVAAPRLVSCAAASFVRNFRMFFWRAIAATRTLSVLSESCKRCPRPFE